MTEKYFRIGTEDGKIRGVMTMTFASAMKNLAKDEAVVRFDASVNPKYSHWDFGTENWITDFVEPEISYRQMRQTAFSEITGDEIGVMMQIIHYILKEEPVPEELVKEYQRLMEKIQAVKLDHPKVT